jgi:hypothetical protein
MITCSTAEEIGCKTLKLDESTGQDVVFDGQELHEESIDP